MVQKWSNYRVMVRWLSRFFDYLDRFYIPRIGAFGLQQQAFRCFHDLVKSFNAKFIAAMILMINQDRNGEKIDRSLLKNVTEYFHFTRSVGGSCYDDFQTALLADAAAYYSPIAANEILYNSSADYTYKVQWCLNQENERAVHFLDTFTTGILLKLVRSQLLDQVSTKLAEKMQAEIHGRSTDHQDLVSKCAGLNLGDGGLVPRVEDLFATLMLDRP